MRSAQMVLTAIALFLTQQALAFDSGSTGADGAFNPTVDSEITLPADGVFNFTELNIPPGVTVTFTPNALNTPVTILVSGDAIIDGVIDINGFSAAPSVGAGNGDVADDGLPGRGGPGGFAGGHGGAADASTTNGGARVAQSGFGPGGGIASTTDLNNAFCYGSGGSHATRGEISDSCSPNLFAEAYGSDDLLPLIGGSGGSGGHGSSNGVGSGGGGGGGALLIAASGTLTINGQITADGGYGGDLGHEQRQDFGTVGAGGAGGGIRLVASTIDGSGVISAVGGAGGGFVNTTPENADGGDGRIRLEAEELLYTQRTNPPFSSAEPGELFASGLPQIRIDALVERDGIAVADYTGDDLGQGGSGLRLTSLGRIYAADSSSLFTVWRIRNSRDSKAAVTLDAFGTGFSRQFLLPARSETFFASEIVAGAATHRLFEAGSQVSVKAAGNQPFAYEAPVEDSWGDINSCQVLGHASRFNGFFFGDYQAPSSDVQGRLAAAGNISLNHYSIADVIPAFDAGITLLSGGDIDFPSGRVYVGDIVAGGQANLGDPVLFGLSSEQQVVEGAALPFSFDIALDRLSALAASLAEQPANGVSEFRWGGLYLNGDGVSNQQVFNLDGAEVLSAHTFDVQDIPVDATVVFNISGLQAGLTNMSLQSLSAHRDRVLFNFHEATSLQLSGIGVEGSILAPFADINQPQGVVLGTVIGRSWNGMMQLNHHSFVGCLPGGGAGNQAPVAFSQQAEVLADSQLALVLEGQDPEGDELSFEITTQPTHGTLSGSAPLLTYTPDPGFVGQDQFQFVASDGNPSSEPATVVIDVIQLNRPPTVEDQQLQTEINAALAIELTAQDPDGDPLTWQIAQQPLHGVLSGQAPLLTYQPNPDFVGLDQFEYRVNDGEQNSSIALITIDVFQPNRPPTAFDQQLRTTVDTTLPIALMGSDPDNDPLDFEIVQSPQNGTLQGQPPVVQYVPDPGFVGTDRFEFRALDSSLTPSLPATISIEIIQPNRSPLAFGQQLTTDADTALAIELTGSDPDNDPLDFEITQPPRNGTLQGPLPLVEYIPDSGFSGSDSFEFRVLDPSSAASLPALVTIQVISTNQPPRILSLPPIQVAEDILYEYDLDAVDEDNDPVTYTLDLAPEGMSVDSASGQIEWLPDPSLAGNRLEPHAECRLSASEQNLLPPAIDAVMLIDASGSNVESWPWVSGAMADLNADLQLEGIGLGDTPNRYGLLAWGSRRIPVLFDDEQFGTIGDLVAVTYDGQPVSAGGTENGLWALQETIDTYSFREDVPRNLIFVADEPQQGTLADGETLPDFVERLRDGRFRLNTISSLPIQCMDGRDALGMDAEGRGYVADGAGGFELCEPDRSVIDDATGGYLLSYVEPFLLPALELGGAIWKLQVIREGGLEAQSLQRALTAQLFNSILVDVPARDQADLTIESVRISGTSDTVAQFAVSILNRGLTSSVIETSLHVVAGNNPGVVLDETLIAPLAAGASQSAVLSVPLPLPETLTFSLADVGLDECSVDNNSLTVPLVSARASDPQGASDTQTFAINVTDVNQPPRIVSTAPAQASLGQTYEYQVLAEDPDRGDALIYSVEGNVLATIDAATGLLRYQPQTGDVGQQDLVVRVVDLAGATDEQLFAITINDDYILPTFDGPPTNLRALIGAPYVFTPPVTSDPTATLTFSLLEGPAGLTIQPLDGTITWVPQPDDFDQLRLVTLALEDAFGNRDALSFVLFGDVENEPPQFSSEPVTRIQWDGTYSYFADIEDSNARDVFTFEVISGLSGMSASLFPATTNRFWIRSASNIRNTGIELRPDTDFLCRVPGAPSAALPFYQKWAWGNVFVSEHVISLPIRDTNADGSIDALDDPDVIGFSNQSVYALDGRTGQEIWSFIPQDDLRVSSTYAPAVVDLNNDGIPELITASVPGILTAWNVVDQSLVWQGSEPIGFQIPREGRVEVTDLEGDGDAEILVGPAVFDHQGVLRFRFQSATLFQTTQASAIRAVDLNGDGQLELLYRDEVRDADGNLLWVTPNVSPAVIAYWGVADFEGDGQVELIQSARYQDGTAAMTVMDQQGNLMHGPISLINAGRPVVGDMNGDGSFEIFIPGQNTLFDTSGNEIWSAERSGFPADGAVASAADLQGNGRLELLLGGVDRGVSVVDGLTGVTMVNLSTSRSTDQAHLAQIVDLDRDGQPEVLIASSRSIELNELSGVNRPDLTGFAHHTQIGSGNLNADLAIDADAPDQWQQFGTDQIVIRNESLFTGGLPDLRLAMPQGDHRDAVAINVRNRGTADYVSEFRVQLWAGDPAVDGVLLDEQSVDALAIGADRMLNFSGVVPVDFVGELFARIDTAAPETECTTDNNATAAYTVDLTVADHAGAEAQQNYLLGTFLSRRIGSISAGFNFETIELEPLTINVERQGSVDAESGYFYVENPPEGLTQDPDSGLINWTPRRGQAGIYELTLRFQGLDTFTTRRITVVVQPRASSSPNIISEPPFEGSVGNLYQYPVVAVDAEDDPITYSLEQAPAGMTIDPDSGLIEWLPLNAGAVQVSIAATDDSGLAGRQDFLLTIIAGDGNRPPRIVSVPSPNAGIGQPYAYALQAADPDGDPVTFSLLNGPVGMLLNPAQNVLEWTPTIDQLGTFEVEVQASDGRNGFATQRYQLTVDDPDGIGGTPQNAPVITSTPPFFARAGDQYRYSIVAVDADSDDLNYSLIAGPEGMTVDAASGELLWTPDAVGSTGIVIQVDDGVFSVQQFWDVVVFSEDTELQVNVTATPRIVDPDAPVQVNVAAFGISGAFDLTLTLDGQPVMLDAAFSATVSASDPGTYTLLATLTNNGAEVQDSTTFIVRDPSATGSPEVSLLTPDFEQEVTAPTDIIATVEDNDVFTEWTLAYRSRSSLGDFTILAQGEGDVNEAVLAQFDPSLLLNGLYDIVLQATNANGQTATDQRTVRVTGDFKVGNFSITFEDLSVPVAGLPVTVRRTYDSRRRNELLNFGYGWSVDYQDVRVEESRRLGLGWDIIQKRSGPFGAFIDLCVVPLGDIVVTVTLPDGEVESFEVGVVNECNRFTAVIDFLEFEFRPIDDTSSTLVETDFSGGMRLVNGNLVENSTFIDIADPNHYVLTTREGFVYELDQAFGIRTITDPNGNTLTYTDDGITHSSGFALEFVRDPLGRITDIIAPDGSILSYDYDPAGDLIGSVDANSGLTQYTYVNGVPHLLEDIIDPRGIRVSRNEYDDDGRLIATIDADGHRIELDHDIEGRTETITDRNGNRTVYVYSDRGDVLAESLQVCGITDGDPNNTNPANCRTETTTRTYNAFGYQLTETNPLGQTTTWTYDAIGNVLSETNDLGETTEYTYDSGDRLLTMTDPSGTLAIDNTYDGRGNLLSVRDALGHETGFDYLFTTGLLETMTDAEGQVTRFEYDFNNGFKIADIDARGTRTEYVNDEHGRVLEQRTTRTAADGAVIELVTAYAYDANGNVTRTTRPDGTITRTEYNAADQVIAEIDAKGNRTEYEYNARGEQALIRYPDGSTETTVFDPNGNIVETTDRLGRITKMIYDQADRLVETIYPDATPADDSDNPRSRSEYDPAGRMTASIDENGHRTEYAHDAAGRRTLIRDALGHETRTEYDERGRRTAVIDALNRRTEFIYDDAGRLLESIHPDATLSTDADNPRTRTEYDGLGRKTADINEAGIRTEYEYDTLGNLIAVIQDATGFAYRTEYAYDEQSNKTVQRDALGRETTWEYDNLARVVSRTLPLGQTETMSYDAAGNRIGRIDFNGNASTYQFDTLNRETRAEYADGDVITITYTDNGLMDRVTDRRGITDYSYDERDRLARVEHPNGEVIEYTYDAVGNRTGLITANQAVGYGFDALNRLSTVDDGSGTTSYGYNPVGNRAFVHHANGTRTDYAYDERNRLIDLTHRDAFGAPFSRQTYTRADTGHKTSLTELDGRTVDYTYDRLYRLTEERATDSARGDRTTRWTFDEVGNRQTQTDNGVLTSYVYDLNDRLETETTSSEVISYTYDANGNTLEKQINGLIDTTYAYDRQDRLIQADTGTATINYAYDAMGIRQSKTENGTLTEFLVDANRTYAQVIEETRASDTITYLRGDDLISQARASTVSTYHADGQGTTKALTDVAGAATDQFIYTAYGEVEHREGMTDSDFLYTGEQFDAGLGFYYLRARYYNPSNGRFPTMDTYQGRVGEPQTLHKYLYVHADPVNNIDPSGNIAIGGGLGVAQRIATRLQLTAISTVRVNTRRLAANDALWTATAGGASAIRAAGVGIATAFALTASSQRRDRFFNVPIIVFGKDVPGHANHIRDAQMGQGSSFLPAPFALNRVKPWPRGWYNVNSVFECNKEARLRAGPNRVCDEYPFASTRQGGPANYVLDKVSLRLLSSTESSLTRDLIGAFYRKADIRRDGFSRKSRFIALGIPGSRSFFTDRQGNINFR